MFLKKRRRKTIYKKNGLIKSKFSIFLAAIALIFFCLFGIIKAEPKQQPNLLLITVDTLRADYVGIYGGRVKTPVMDRLANSGIIFTRTYSHVPLTLPSHCSILTGTVPPVHGIRDNSYRFPQKNKTLAEILKERGYLTAAFVGAFPLDSRFGLDTGFDLYDDNYGSKNLQRDLTFVERKAEEVTKKAAAWLENNKDKNFFLWVHYFDPHAPYEPPSPFSDEYRGREYEGEIAYTDQQIGQLLEKLNSLGLTEKTITILTSDHGESLGEHQEKTHGIFIYDSTLRVPLIFSNPRLFPKCKKISELTCLSDVFPTILDLLNIPYNREQTQGRSLKEAILKNKPLGDREIYIESIAAMLDRNWAPLQGLIYKNWKYIKAPQPELYDLDKDAKELTNLFEKKPQEALRLQSRLQEFISRHDFISTAELKRRELDKETYEKLKSLGYISAKIISTGENPPDPKEMIEIDNLFNEAVILSEAGRLEEASLAYETLLKKQPNFAVGYEYAAYNFYKSGKLEDAISLLRQALQLNLATPSIKARLGLYLQEYGQIDESIQLLQEALQQDPFYTEAYNYLGVSYFKMGSLERAETAFQGALKLDSDYAMAINNLGNVYLAQGKYDQAINAYYKATSIDPHLASSFNGLGVAFYRKGTISDALKNWKKALEIDETQAEAAYNLGKTFLKLNNKEEALKYLELFLKVAPLQKYGQDIKQVSMIVEKLKEEIKMPF